MKKREPLKLMPLDEFGKLLGRLTETLQNEAASKSVKRPQKRKARTSQA